MRPEMHRCADVSVLATVGLYGRSSAQPLKHTPNPAWAARRSLRRVTHEFAWVMAACGTPAMCATHAAPAAGSASGSGGSGSGSSSDLCCLQRGGRNKYPQFFKRLTPARRAARTQMGCVELRVCEGHDSDRSAIRLRPHRRTLALRALRQSSRAWEVWHCT